MKEVEILSARRGINVVAAEAKLESGTVRKAENVLIHRGGSFERRSGYSRVLDVPRAHSLYVAPQSGRLLFVADGTLYEYNKQTATSTTLATGLWERRARFAEIDGVVYVSAGRMLRIGVDDVARTLGVASLLGHAPVLTAAVPGGLLPGKYSVAVTAVNAAGIESGSTDIARIELTGGFGGITVAFPPVPDEAALWRVYRTQPNGTQLSLALELPVTTSVLLTSTPTTRPLDTWLLEPLPSGGALAAYNSRLYSACGSFLCYSDAFNPELHSVNTGYIMFEGSCENMVLPVEGGIYVGTDTAVYFLRGGGPAQFQMEVVSGEGAKYGSGALVSAHMFDPRLIGEGHKEVAVWLSQSGYQIGTPDGRVIAPQGDRVLISDCPSASTAAVVQKGIKQLISAVESMTMGDGGAADSTL